MKIEIKGNGLQAFEGIKAMLENSLDDICIEYQAQNGIDLPELSGNDYIIIGKIDRCLDELADLILELYN